MIHCHSNIFASVDKQMLEVANLRRRSSIGRMREITNAKSDTEVITQIGNSSDIVGFGVGVGS